LIQFLILHTVVRFGILLLFLVHGASLLCADIHAGFSGNPAGARRGWQCNGKNGICVAGIIIKDHF